MQSFELLAAGGPFHDPGLLVSFQNLRHSLLFDCGTLHSLQTRDLLKVRWLFLSHLHIDHLIGFDHLLRVRLFSDLPLEVFGPPGTVEVIAHRLQGYAWNLTSGSPFCITAHDLGRGELAHSKHFRCQDQFQAEEAENLPEVEEEKLQLGQGLQVLWHPVDHGVACYCYRLERHFTPKFSLQKCQSLGLEPGPWIRRLTEGQKLSLEVQGELRDARWLSEQLVQSVPADSLGFLTDTKMSLPLHESLKEFYRGVQWLVSECAYLQEDANLAEQNLHLTTSQVARLALECEAEELFLFHLSRRYQESGPEKHISEARDSFPHTSLLSGKRAIKSGS